MKTTGYLKAVIVTWVIFVVSGSVVWGAAGDILWKFETVYSIEGTPAIADDGTIYFGLLNNNYVYALNPAGTLEWKYKVVFESPHPWNFSSSVIGSDGTIYIGTNEHNLYALNPNGTLKWKYLTDYTDIFTSPAIGSDGTIYFENSQTHTPESCLYALNPDGTVKWKYDTGDKSEYRSHPAIGSNGTVYIGSKDNALLAVNPNGTLKWKYDVGYDTNGIVPAIGLDGTIYFGCKDGFLYALNLGGTLKWKQDGEGSEPRPVIGSDGTVYYGSSRIFAVNTDGTLKWEYHIPPGFGIFTSPLIGNDGTIYTGDHAGYFYAINPDGTLKWSIQIEGRINTSPTINDNGIIYFVASVFSDEGEMINNALYAIDTGTNAGLADAP